MTSNLLEVEEVHVAQPGVGPAENVSQKPVEEQGAFEDQIKPIAEAGQGVNGLAPISDQGPDNTAPRPTLEDIRTEAPGGEDAGVHAPPLHPRLIRSLYYEDEEDEEEEAEEVEGEGGEEDDLDNDDDDRGPFEPKDRWTRKATQMLIDLWADQRLKAGKPYMKHGDWQEIMNGLNAASDAPPLTERQVKDKLFYMKKKFKQNRKKRLAGRKSLWSYYDRMAAVFEVDKQWSSRAKPDSKPIFPETRVKRQYKKRGVNIAPSGPGVGAVGGDHLGHGLVDTSGLPLGAGQSGADGLMASYRNIAIRDFAMSAERAAGGNLSNVGQDRHLPSFSNTPYAAHPKLPSGNQNHNHNHNHNPNLGLSNFGGMLPPHSTSQPAGPGVTVLPGLPNLLGMQSMSGLQGLSGMQGLANHVSSLPRLNAPGAVDKASAGLVGLFPNVSPVLSFEETFEIEYVISQLQNSPPPGKDPISEADRLKLLDLVEGGHKGVIVAWRVAKESKARNPARDLLLEFWIGVSRHLTARKRNWAEVDVGLGTVAVSHHPLPNLGGRERPPTGF